jgi:homoserine O-acetyltransferase/O-succinyltransferase
MIRALKLSSVVFPIVLAGLSAAAAQTRSYPDQTEGDFVIRDFRFMSGETLPELKLHYTTLGTPQRNPDGRIRNAVLLLHGTTGTGKSFLAPRLAGAQFGPAQPLDASRYYVVLPDGIGRGGSSKPSDGLHAHFPRYGYRDVVEGQYRLMTEGLKIDHLRLVLGTSMGGMQTWMWGEMHPDMMDALMPIASLPVQISGRNLLFRKVLTESIRRDPAWRDGEYREQPTQFAYVVPELRFMASSPAKLQQLAPTRAAAVELYDKMLESARRTFDANDLLYWFESSFDYDPEPGLGKIKARLRAVNFADDAINPDELGILERLTPMIPGARYTVVPASERTSGHETLTLAAVWKPYLVELLQSLPKVSN